MTDVDEAADTSGGRRRGSRRSAREGRAGKKPMPLWLESIVLLGIALALAVLPEGITTSRTRPP